MISALVNSTHKNIDVKKVLENLSFVNELIVITDINKLNLSELREDDIIVIVVKNEEEGIAKCTHEWVLKCEHDDFFNEELQLEIKRISAQATSDIFTFKRKFSFMGKEVKKGKYTSSNPCEFFPKKESLNEKSIVNVSSLFVQKRYDGFDTYNTTISLESIEQAKALFEKDVRPNLYHLLLKPYGAFFNKYIASLGFLDGKEGFILAYLNSFGVFKRYIHLWALYRNIN